jgi:hypothetical protein
MLRQQSGFGRTLAFTAQIFMLACGTILACSPPTVPSEDPDHPPLKTVADVPLPGPAVRFDYQSLDPTQGGLYIAHMNADQLVVFDTKKRQVVANLDGFPNVHEVWAVPELGRVYASAAANTNWPWWIYRP